MEFSTLFLTGSLIDDELMKLWTSVPIQCGDSKDPYQIIVVREGHSYNCVHCLSYSSRPLSLEIDCNVSGEMFSDLFEMQPGVERSSSSSTQELAVMKLETALLSCYLLLVRGHGVY